MNTVFVRTHNRPLKQVCSLAHVPLVDAGTAGPITAYLGVMQGRYRPTHCACHATNKRGADLWKWLEAKGFERAPDLDIPPQGHTK
jgi:hypothetical protein